MNCGGWFIHVFILLILSVCVVVFRACNKYGQFERFMIPIYCIKSNGCLTFEILLTHYYISLHIHTYIYTIIIIYTWNRLFTLTVICVSFINRNTKSTPEFFLSVFHVSPYDGSSSICWGAQPPKLILTWDGTVFYILCLIRAMSVQLGVRSLETPYQLTFHIKCFCCCCGCCCCL